MDKEVYVFPIGQAFYVSIPRKEGEFFSHESYRFPLSELSARINGIRKAAKKEGCKIRWILDN